MKVASFVAFLAIARASAQDCSVAATTKVYEVTTSAHTPSRGHWETFSGEGTRVFDEGTFSNIQVTCEEKFAPLGAPELATPTAPTAPTPTAPTPTAATPTAPAPTPTAPTPTAPTPTAPTPTAPTPTAPTPTAPTPTAPTPTAPTPTAPTPTAPTPTAPTPTAPTPTAPTPTSTTCAPQTTINYCAGKSGSTVTPYVDSTNCWPINVDGSINDWTKNGQYPLINSTSHPLFLMNMYEAGKTDGTKVTLSWLFGKFNPSTKLMDLLVYSAPGYKFSDNLAMDNYWCKYDSYLGDVSSSRPSSAFSFIQSAGTTIAYEGSWSLSATVNTCLTGAEIHAQINPDRTTSTGRGEGPPPTNINIVSPGSPVP